MKAHTRLTATVALIAMLSLPSASCGTAAEPSSDALTPASVPSSSTTATAAANECAPLIVEQVARTQAIIDELAPLSLSQLAVLPDAPTVVHPWWKNDPTLTKGTFIPTDEMSPEMLAEIEAADTLLQRCFMDLYLSPLRNADQLDLESPAAAIAWAQKFAIATFVPFDAQFPPDGQAELEALFHPPPPESPMLSDPEGLSCSSLEEVVLHGAQSLIDTHSFGTYEFDDATEDWIAAVEQATILAGCGEDFYARTVAANGHRLTTDDLIEVPIRAQMISGAWTASWQSFRD